MDPADQARFDKLLDAMTQPMQLHGLRDKTIDIYRRTLYRVAGHFGRCPDDSHSPWTGSRAGLTESVSQALWLRLPAWVEVGGIAPSPCPKPHCLQPIST